MIKHSLLIGLLASVGSLIACGGGGGDREAPAQGATVAPQPLIKANQIGYMTGSEKFAVVPNVTATEFSVVNASDDSVVMTGALSDSALWQPANQTVKTADFSALTAPGEYKISVEGVDQASLAFSVSDDIYSELQNAALRYYYYNRASTALGAEHAGRFARAAGHPDTQVYVANGAQTPERPVNMVLSAPKGWYDAGDYNKYVVNSGISTYTLMAAYEHFSDFYTGRDVNIPESGDAVPDILDEVMWNLDWLEAMQDTDGGVYHKLTTEDFSGQVMPANASARRFVVQKGTAATLNFAATLAVASRVYDNFETQFPGKAAAYKAAAERAYNWAKANPDVVYQDNPQIFSSTGAYGDSNFGDEFAWAAAELFILTEDAAYLADYLNQNQEISSPAWPNVAGLAYMSLAEHGEGLLTELQYQSVTSAIISLGDRLSDLQAGNPFKVPMATGNFVWGSNSSAMNNGMMAYQAYRLTGERKYFNVATAAADYVLGRNAVDLSMVTGFGARSTRNTHHRPSFADNIADPIPGFLAGGPNPGRQDGCPNYIGTQPATAYVDDWCSYASNEVTINWNAPLVYVTAALAKAGQADED